MGDSPITAHSDCRLTFNQCHRHQRGFSVQHYGTVLIEHGFSENRSCAHLDGQFDIVFIGHLSLKSGNAQQICDLKIPTAKDLCRNMYMQNVDKIK